MAALYDRADIYDLLNLSVGQERWKMGLIYKFDDLLCYCSFGRSIRGVDRKEGIANSSC